MSVATLPVIGRKRLRCRPRNDKRRRLEVLQRTLHRASRTATSRRLGTECDRGPRNRLPRLISFPSDESRDLLMQCEQCRTRYSAAWAQPAPGGSSSPGVLLALAAVFFCATAAAFVLGVAYVRWIGVALSALVAIRIPIAWTDCRSRSGLSGHGGGVCPNCGIENPVRPWSL